MKNEILSENLLVWIDLETTGFDKDCRMFGCISHKILEIGVHVTDNFFNILDEGLSLVIHHNKNIVSDLSIDIVKDLHRKSGLIDAVEKSTLTLKEAEKMIIEHLVKHGVKSGISPICGNNVSFDKNFIDAQLLELSDFLHYRKIDVSSFKEVFRRRNVELSKNIKKRLTHRALDDIKESIEEMKLYSDFIFK